jgi:hypothetical protein
MDMTEDEALKKQVRVMEISMTPAFVAVFAFIFYFLYLKTIGIEISTAFMITVLLFMVLPVATIACLTLNECLLRVLYHERFNIKRLVFRCTLPIMYVSLLWVTSLLTSVILPRVEVFFQFFFGVLLATAVFVLVLLRFRHLFSRLDKGEW